MNSQTTHSTEARTLTLSVTLLQRPRSVHSVFGS